MSLEQSLFQLKFAAKSLKRQSQKASRDELIEKANVKKVRLSLQKAIQAGNYDIAKIYASTAIRKHSEALNLLRLASRVDAVSSRLSTAMTMRNVGGNLANVVKGIERAIKSMNLEQIALIMDKFESQIEDLDVQSSYMENVIFQAIQTSTATSTPQDEVDLLMQKIADEAGLELSQDLMNAVPSENNIGENNTLNDFYKIGFLWIIVLKHSVFMSQFREERPSRSLPNPVAKTESAREALQSFFCKLCDKGYQRISEYENHLSSYEHNHRKACSNYISNILQMQKVSSNFEKLRKQGQKKKDSEMISFLDDPLHKNSDVNMKPLKLDTSDQFSAKKVGFKKAFGNTDTLSNTLNLTTENSKKIHEPDDSHKFNIKENPLIDSSNRFYKDSDCLYNPRFPTSP
ncbi:hypothetical protein PORY_000359 [Pneumocystis oryctolagi]|uniref:Uncharacterized protein n=1 Tax=Pneumocystis oryctolagi TaxID=42067 RepID=A0ACB7CFK6_9ASCO|nr:hypothetical protein PORY_000359 [Pneumocystis oryctolagi]